MARNVFILFLLLSSRIGVAQKIINEYAATDKTALSIPEEKTQSTGEIAGYINSNFKSGNEKVRAIFIWTASNIQYDVENMYAINFYEKKEEKISKALQTRKGVCEAYAAIFNEICSQCGIRSYVVAGYTMQNGVVANIPHAWCAAFIENTWYLFDPTWAAGYVDKNKFIKKINNSYFKVLPANLIKTHMPFDPLWECLYYPITNQEFYEGKTQVNKAKPYFSYPDSINAYEAQGEIGRLTASAIRIEKNGVKNSLIFDRLQHMRNEVETYSQNQMVNSHNKAINTYNAAIANYNEGINFLNVFIKYRNDQFVPKKTDPEIQSMVDSADTRAALASQELNEIQDADAATVAMIASFRNR